MDAGNLQGGVTLTLSEEISGLISVNGPAIPISLRPAQNAALTFDGSTSQVITVGVTGNTMCVRVTLRNPAGTSMASTLSCGGSFNLTPQTLVENGVYTVFVDPSGTATGSLNLSVTSP